MTTTVSFDDLLASRLLDVPDYQRGYAWGQDQLEEFWEDLDLIEGPMKHYTGTVVLRSSGSAMLDEARETVLEPFDVVDGQQRLTTCSLILDRIHDRLEALGDDEAPVIRRRLLTATVDGVKRPKLQLGADIREYWHRVILEGEAAVDGPRLSAERRLAFAAQYFEERLDEVKKNVEPAAYRSRLRKIAGKVASNLQFTVYTVGDDSEVGVLFETLNQRGKELTELEKTKNYLLFLVNLLPAGPRADLAAIVNDCWKRIFTNLGAAELGANHEDQLLRAHWLATQDPDQKSWEKAKSVKTRFHRRRYAEDKAALHAEVREYAESLRDASVAYRDLLVDSNSSYSIYGVEASTARQASRRLRHAGVVAIFAPLVIAARLSLTQPQDGAAFASLVDLCERYSVRVFLINERRGNAGSARLYRLANQLHRSGTLADALVGLRERIAFFASDEDTFAALRSPRRDWYGKVGHKYFLYEYEIYLQGGQAPALAYEHFARGGDFRRSTTEHVLPQTPTNDCWKGFSPDDRSTYTNALGNLVLTQHNSVYSNFCFARKRDGVLQPDGSTSDCFRNAVLKQEQEIAVHDDWTVDTIEQRQEKLAAWALDRWRVETPAQAGTTSSVAAAVADEELDADDNEDPVLDQLPDDDGHEVFVA